MQHSSSLQLRLRSTALVWDCLRFTMDGMELDYRHHALIIRHKLETDQAIDDLIIHISNTFNVFRRSEIPTLEDSAQYEWVWLTSRPTHLAILEPTTLARARSEYGLVLIQENA